MPWFISEYVSSGRKYGADLWAKDFSDAKVVANRRGIGEAILGQGREHRKPFFGCGFPSDLIRQRVLAKKDAIAIVHGVTFLSYIAIESDTYNVGQVLGDTGWLHETIHCLANGNPKRTKMVKWLREVEFVVPGFRRPENWKGY